MDDNKNKTENTKSSNLQDETSKFVNVNNSQNMAKNSGDVTKTSSSSTLNIPKPPVMPTTQSDKTSSQPVSDLNQEKTSNNSNFDNLTSSHQTPPAPAGTVPSMNTPQSSQKNSNKDQQNKDLGKNAQQSAVTIESKKSGRGWGVFITISVVILLAIFAGLAYLYFDNQKLKEKAAQTTDITTPIEEKVTPTPSFSPEQIKILNGNVIREVPGSDKITLINKNETESTGITGFASVSVSPDNQYLCIESWSPSPKPALYSSKVDGSELIEISANKIGCTWAPNSDAIFYTNFASDTKSTDIYVYYLDSNSEINLTRSSVTESVVRRFNIVGFSVDESKLICSYEDVDSDGGVSNCEINISDQTLNYLE